ncbi:MAG: response regulator [Burkholderiaceae bacterium]
MNAPRVLIVDDNPINLELTTFILRSDGFVVNVSADARQAIESVARCRPDLILMDIQMPEVDGLELTRRLKADPSTTDIPVIALTAYAMKGDEKKMLAAGCNGYLSKPIDVVTFAATVRGFLSGGVR